MIAAGELTEEIRRDGSLFEQSCEHRERGRLSILIDSTGTLLLFALDWRRHQWIIASKVLWLNFHLYYVTFQS